MAQKRPRITINIPASSGYTKPQLESLKNAFNVQLASIHRARRGEDDSPVGETNVSRRPSASKGTKRPGKKGATKK